MTETALKKKNTYKIIKSFLMLTLFMSVSLFGAERISEEVLSAIKFSATVMIPSIFPFMVFSDFAAHTFEFERSRFLSHAFERTFKINSCAISSFFAGITGGFPIGAKNALLLYENGKISKCECERLMSFSNTASPAYTICAVGIGILSDVKSGFVIYSSLVISSVITGFLIGLKKEYIHNSEFTFGQNYDFIGSVKNAATACVNLIFFVSFFSAICAIIKALPISIYLKAILCALSEVTNAVAYISDLCIFTKRIKLSLIAFALSFSGFSVILQSLALAKKQDFKIRKCLFYKLIQAIISFIIVLIFPL